MVTAHSPRCTHFGECGGCRRQDLSYEDQLEAKKKYLEDLFHRPVPLHPSPDIWYYRNKMEYSFGDVYPPPEEGEDDILLGLKERGKWYRVLNLSECYLLSPEAPALLEAVHTWARNEGLAPYNVRRHVGFLRHLLVREGKLSGERLVLLLTVEGSFPRESFVEAVESVYPATTILRGQHNGRADAAILEEVKVLTGSGFIEEVLLGKTFRISPKSFFQTNSRGAEILYSLIREWIAPLRPERILDLYCGGGAIGILLADLCQEVLGVDVVEEAVADARYNAKENGVFNIEFVTGKVEKVLRDWKGSVDTVILDPPRAGMHPKARKAVCEMAPPRILYVSCNPKNFARDLEKILEGYEMVRIEGVDLFPHTDHVEAVALFERKPQDVSTI